MQKIDSFFTNKYPLFILSNNRTKNEFYKYFAINKDFYMNLDSMESKQNINKDSKEEIESSFRKYCDIFNFSKKINNTDLKSYDTFLPVILSISEFFSKIIFTNLPMISPTARVFFMNEALKYIKINEAKVNKKLSFLNSISDFNDDLESVSKNNISFEENFISYLETSNVLLNFYNELRSHKIPINKESILDFSTNDINGIQDNELKILSKIYDKYLEMLDKNKLCDCIYSDISKNYKIDSKFLEFFSCIHIDLEGFISPLQYDILQNVAKYIPVYLHFKTDKYNISNFKFVNKEIKENMQYIFSIHNSYLFGQKVNNRLCEIKLYKSEKTINQVNLALFLAHNWITQINENKASENDFAIILPNEKFSLCLLNLDSNNFLNYAMGESIESLHEFQILCKIYESFIESGYIDIKILLTYMQERNINNKYFELNKIENYQINNPTLEIIQKILFILFKRKHNKILSQAIDILTELLILKDKQILKDIPFKDLFITFMQGFSSLRMDNVGGGKIRVMGALEARNIKFKEVLILDFTDDFIPKINYDDMFLNSNIRKKVNMPTRKDKENLYKHHYYGILRNTEKAHISYVENDEKMPSTLLYELEPEIKLSLNNCIDIDKEFSFFDTKKGCILDKKLDDKDKEFPLFNDKKCVFSATALNNYKKCTRKFYFKYIEQLELQDLESHTNAGSIIHDFLYKSYKPFINQDLNKKNIMEISKIFFDSYNKYAKEFLKNLESKNINKQDSKITDINVFIKLDNLCSKMNIFFNKEIERVNENKITLLDLEYSFEATLNNNKCIGFVDRIEKVNDDIVIIDYKSGKIPLVKCDNINDKKRKEIDLQLPFYNMCASQMDILNDFRNQKIVLYYADLKDSSSLSKMETNVLQEGEKEINEIFSNFGSENKQCKDISTCHYCEYNTLCGR